MIFEDQLQQNFATKNFFESCCKNKHAVYLSFSAPIKRSNILHIIFYYFLQHEFAQFYQAALVKKLVV